MLVILLLLAGCASEAERRVSAACEAGDMQACGALLQAEASEEQADAAMWGAMQQSGMFW